MTFSDLRSITIVVLTAALAGALPTLSADAQPIHSASVQRASAVIDHDNLEAYANLLTAALRYAVSHGMRIRVAPAHRIEWPSEYLAATEQYAAQVTLDESGAMRNYVAGLPFPNLTPNDPRAALKLAYDWRWGPFIPEEVFGSNLASRAFTFSPDAVTFAPDLAHGDSRNEYICDSAVAVRTSHRLHPAAIDDNVGLDWKFRDDQCGPEQSKFIAWLYSDPSRMPDSWFYSRDSRHWRRLAMPDTPTQSCTYSCTQISMEYEPPQTGLYEWTLESRRTMLGCFDGGSTVAEPDGTTFGEISCEPREVYILQLKPKQVGSDVLPARVYLDAETFAYLGGEMFRDKNPDLSAAFWTRDRSPADGSKIRLAADMYVADDRPGSFLWLDATSRLTYAGEAPEKMFNPKAEN